MLTLHIESVKRKWRQYIDRTLGLDMADIVTVEDRKNYMCIHRVADAMMVLAVVIITSFGYRLLVSLIERYAH